MDYVLLILPLILVGVLLYPEPSYACSCDGETGLGPEDYFQKYDSIFVG